MINGQIAIRKRREAAIAKPLLLPKEVPFVRINIVLRYLAKVRPDRNVGAMDSLVKQPQFLIEPRFDEISSFG